MKTVLRVQEWYCVLDGALLILRNCKKLVDIGQLGSIEEMNDGLVKADRMFELTHLPKLDPLSSHRRSLRSITL